MELPIATKGLLGDSRALVAGVSNLHEECVKTDESHRPKRVICVGQSCSRTGHREDTISNQSRICAALSYYWGDAEQKQVLSPLFISLHHC
jgi:hypothetical protein